MKKIKEKEIPIENIAPEDPVLAMFDVEAAAAELAKQDFTFFIKEFWDIVVQDRLIWNWHMDVLVNDLTTIAFNLVNGKPKTDYIANLPPGSSKSTIISVLYPVWLWVLNPELTIISISYADDVAQKFAERSRDILQSVKFKKWYPYVIIRPDTTAKSHFKNTSGGERISTGVGSAITGYHADLLVGDDLQSAKKGSSAVERAKVNEWLSETLPTRKKSLVRTPTIIVQQRLHLNDCTGYLLTKGTNYKRLCIPAEINESLFPRELEKFYKKGLYFPERFPKSALDNLKEEQGSRAYNCQLLQNPSSDEDATIKEGWLKVIPLDEYNKIIEGKNAVTNFYLDSSQGEKKKNDPSAILACVKIDFTLYIMGVETVKLETFRLIEFIRKWVNENNFTPQSRLFVEPKSTGPAIVSMMMNQTDLNVIKGADPRDNKESRFEAISPTIQGGKVILVDTGKWNIDKFLSEVTAAKPLHDDQRDVLTAAVTAQIINKPASYGTYSWR